MTQWEKLMKSQGKDDGMVTLYTCEDGMRLSRHGESFIAWLDEDSIDTAYIFDVYFEDLLPDDDEDIEVQAYAPLENVVKLEGKQ